MAQSIIFLILLGVLVDPLLLFGCAIAVFIGGMVGVPLVARARVWIVQLVVAIGLVARRLGLCDDQPAHVPRRRNRVRPAADADDRRHPRQLRLRHPRQFRGRQLCADPGHAEPDGHGPEALLPDHGDRRLARWARARACATSGSRRSTSGSCSASPSAASPRCWSPPSSSRRCRSKSLRWLVFVVVLYTAAVMGRAALKGRREERAEAATRRSARGGPDHDRSPRCPQPGFRDDTTRCARRTPIGSPSTKATSSTRTIEIATLDFAPFLRGNARDKARFAEAFGAALQEIGFAVLTGHGVDPALYDEMHDSVLDLFTSTPLEREDALPRRSATARSARAISRSRRPATSIPTWSRAGSGAGARSIFPSSATRRSARRITGRAPNMSAVPPPRRSPTKPCSSRSRRPCSRASAAIRISMTTSSRETNFGLRANYYPPMSGDQDRSGAGRLLGHEDVDLFTILPATRVDGLQVWNHRSGKWVRLRAPPGSIIINTGDYMQRITNDRLPSTTHRVGKPSDGSHLPQARVSFPMAVYLWEDEILEVLPELGPPRYRRSRRSPSTRAAPASSTATTMRSRPFEPALRTRRSLLPISLCRAAIPQ